MLQLVNTEQEKVQDNEKVKECIEVAKLARKRVVRYIQVSISRCINICGTDEELYSLLRTKS